MRALRLFSGYTIDASHSKDLDDAFLVLGSHRDGWLVEIAIANVADTVAAGSQQDCWARRVGATTYRGKRVVQQMLDADLVWGLSLQPHRDVPCVLFRIELEPTHLAVRSFSVERRMFQSAGRLTYTDIPYLLREVDHPAYQHLHTAYALADRIFHTRLAGGAFLEVDPDSRMQTADHPGERIVSELMILTNTAAARYLRESYGRGVFRNHLVPDVAMAQMRKALTAGDLRKVATIRRQHAYHLPRAIYAATCDGHTGLGVDAYTHATSPLRRYADLVNQRILLDGTVPDDLEDICDDITQAMLDYEVERKDFYKQRESNRINSRLERMDLTTVEPKVWDRLFRDALGSDALTPELLAAARARVEAGTFTPTDLARMLRYAHGDGTMQEDLRYLAAIAIIRRPRLGNAAWNEAAQKYQFPQPKVRLDICAEGGFIATATLGLLGTDYQQSATAPRSTLARLLAIAKATVAFLGGNPDSVTLDESELDDDPKTLLYSLCAQQGWPRPQFTIERTGPDHFPQFLAEVSLTIDGTAYTACTTEPTTVQREAERNAAKALMPKLPAIAKSHVHRGKAISILNSIGQRTKVAPPDYLYAETDGGFSCTCRFKGLEATAIERNKRLAKDAAAEQLLHILVEQTSQIA